MKWTCPKCKQTFEMKANNKYAKAWFKALKRTNCPKHNPSQTLLRKVAKEIGLK